jgi:hypothetical protein
MPRTGDWGPLGGREREAGREVFDQSWTLQGRGEEEGREVLDDDELRSPRGLLQLVFVVSPSPTPASVASFHFCTKLGQARPLWRMKAVPRTRRVGQLPCQRLPKCHSHESSDAYGSPSVSWVNLAAFLPRVRHVPHDWSEP